MGGSASIQKKKIAPIMEKIPSEQEISSIPPDLNSLGGSGFYDEISNERSGSENNSNNNNQGKGQKSLSIKELAIHHLSVNVRTNEMQENGLEICPIDRKGGPRDISKTTRKPLRVNSHLNDNLEAINEEQFGPLSQLSGKSSFRTSNQAATTDSSGGFFCSPSSVNQNKYISDSDFFDGSVKEVPNIGTPDCSYSPTNYALLSSVSSDKPTPALIGGPPIDIQVVPKRASAGKLKISLYTEEDYSNVTPDVKDMITSTTTTTYVNPFDVQKPEAGKSSQASQSVQSNSSSQAAQNHALNSQGSVVRRNTNLRINVASEEGKPTVPLSTSSGGDSMHSEATTPSTVVANRPHDNKVTPTSAKSEGSKGSKGSKLSKEAQLQAAMRKNELSNESTVRVGDFKIRASGISMSYTDSGMGRMDQVCPGSTGPTFMCLGGIFSFVQVGALGTGASGSVVEAVHIPTLTIVALKMLPCYNQQKKTSIESELGVLYKNMADLSLVNSGLEGGDQPTEKEKKKVQCSNILAMYDAFTNVKTGLINLVVEYMDGGSLADLVQAGGCSDELLLGDIARQVLCGLSFLHKNRQIHRDIKPGNILMNSKGEVKLADFGISAALDDSGEETSSAFIGTMNYMSPERLMGNSYGYPSDIWSFGLTLLNVAEGKFPIALDGTGYWGVVHAVCDEPSPTPGPKSSEEFRSFIQSCLYKEPSDRGTADELLGHPFVVKAALIYADPEDSVSSITKPDVLDPLASASEIKQSSTWLGSLIRRSGSRDNSYREKVTDKKKETAKPAGNKFVDEVKLAHLRRILNYLYELAKQAAQLTCILPPSFLCQDDFGSGPNSNFSNSNFTSSEARSAHKSLSTHIVDGAGPVSIHNIQDCSVFGSKTLTSRNPGAAVSKRVPNSSYRLADNIRGILLPEDKDKSQFVRASTLQVSSVADAIFGESATVPLSAVVVPKGAPPLNAGEREEIDEDPSMVIKSVAGARNESTMFSKSRTVYGASETITIFDDGGFGAIVNTPSFMLLRNHVRIPGFKCSKDLALWKRLAHQLRIPSDVVIALAKSRLGSVLDHLPDENGQISRLMDADAEFGDNLFPG